MVNEIFNFLDKTNKTISFAESCTGGALSSSLTMIPGASKVFLGSIVSYSTYSKQKLLSIDKSDLDEYSAVSERVAIITPSFSTSNLLETQIYIGFRFTIPPKKYKRKRGLVNLFFNMLLLFQYQMVLVFLH